MSWRRRRRGRRRYRQRRRYWRGRGGHWLRWLHLGSRGRRRLGFGRNGNLRVRLPGRLFRWRRGIVFRQGDGDLRIADLEFRFLEERPLFRRKFQDRLTKKIDLLQ